MSPYVRSVKALSNLSKMQTKTERSNIYEVYFKIDKNLDGTNIEECGVKSNFVPPRGRITYWTLSYTA